jgi:PHAX RNA-binding domain
MMPHTLSAEQKNALREATNQIAAQLGETEHEPLSLIWRTVRELGVDEALAVLAETLAIEEGGGMLTTDGSRRRTPGGVFLHLVRQRVHGAALHAIFYAKRHQKHAKETTNTEAGETEHTASVSMAPAVPPFTWNDRVAAYATCLESPGGASTVNITLTGRPGQVIEKGAFVMTAMPAMAIPALPKGIPVPDVYEKPKILVYIAAKHWRKVADAIQDPEDRLIVEGFAVYEPAIKGLAVLAQNVTTKHLQQAKRQAMSVAPENAESSAQGGDDAG